MKPTRLGCERGSPRARVSDWGRNCPSRKPWASGARARLWRAAGGQLAHPAPTAPTPPPAGAPRGRPRGAQGGAGAGPRPRGGGARLTRRVYSRACAAWRGPTPAGGRGRARAASVNAGTEPLSPALPPLPLPAAQGPAREVARARWCPPQLQVRGGRGRAVREGCGSARRRSAPPGSGRRVRARARARAGAGCAADREPGRGPRSLGLQREAAREDPRADPDVGWRRHLASVPRWGY